MQVYHPDIYKKLDEFITSRQIPNIIFHGEHGSGKKTILDNFLKNIYKDVPEYKHFVMYVNCAEGKGIKFIRDELKFFAKTNIHNYNGSIIKSIVLLNADFLTIDAQSALRRCIELFSNYTRFFIVINNKTKLIQPMLSRFCSIHVYRPVIKRNVSDLHRINDIKYPVTFYRRKHTSIKQMFDTCETMQTSELIKKTEALYQKGCSGLDCIEYIESNLEESKEKYDLLIYLETLSSEIRNESLLMFMIFKYYKLRNSSYLENIDIL